MQIERANQTCKSNTWTANLSITADSSLLNFVIARSVTLKILHQSNRRMSAVVVIAADLPESS